MYISLTGIFNPLICKLEWNLTSLILFGEITKNKCGYLHMNIDVLKAKKKKLKKELHVLQWTNWHKYRNTNLLFLA